jgi:hypothetical protein
MPMTSTGGAGRGWIVYGVVAAVLVAIIGGTVIFLANTFSSVNSIIDTFGGTPTASGGGGGGPFDPPSTRSGGNRPPAPTIAPSAPPLGPAGGDINLAGVGNNKTIACNDSAVNVSGVSNTIVITGQCLSVTVSGVENTVTVDAAAKISASGFNNRVTYLSGTPEITNSGGDNIVEQG